MESEDAQRRGIVGIWYHVDTRTKKSMNAKLRNAIPFRLAGGHLCLNDLKEYLICSVSVKSSHINRTSRFRLHYGTCEDHHHCHKGHQLGICCCFTRIFHSFQLWMITLLTTYLSHHSLFRYSHWMPVSTTHIWDYSASSPCQHCGRLVYWQPLEMDRAATKTRKGPGLGILEQSQYYWQC